MFCWELQPHNMYAMYVYECVYISVWLYVCVGVRELQCWWLSYIWANRIPAPNGLRSVHLRGFGCFAANDIPDTIRVCVLYSNSSVWQTRVWILQIYSFSVFIDHHTPHFTLYLSLPIYIHTRTNRTSSLTRNTKHTLHPTNSPPLQPTHKFT